METNTRSLDNSLTDQLTVSHIADQSAHDWTIRKLANSLKCLTANLK